VYPPIYSYIFAGDIGSTGEYSSRSFIDRVLYSLPCLPMPTVVAVVLGDKPSTSLIPARLVLEADLLVLMRNVVNLLPGFKSSSDAAATASRRRCISGMVVKMSVSTTYTPPTTRNTSLYALRMSKITPGVYITKYSAQCCFGYV